MKLLDRTLHLRESKRGPRMLEHLVSLSNNRPTKENDMTHQTNIPHYIIDTRAVARRLILLAAIASSASACGVKIGTGVVLGTTSFLEEVNRGVHTESFKEHINVADKAQLQAKLNEVN